MTLMTFIFSFILTIFLFNKLSFCKKLCLNKFLNFSYRHPLICIRKNVSCRIHTENRNFSNVIQFLLSNYFYLGGMDYVSAKKKKKLYIAFVDRRF